MPTDSNSRMAHEKLSSAMNSFEIAYLDMPAAYLENNKSDYDSYIFRFNEGSVGYREAVQILNE